MNMKQFLSTSAHAQLAASVIRQFGGWESFKESAPDVSSHGIDGGFHGFIYYMDTCKFTAKNRANIADLVECLASDLGEDPLTMVSSFECLKNSNLEPGEVGRVLYSARGGDADTRLLIENALAWFAGEEICRAYDDEKNRRILTRNLRELYGEPE